MPRRQFSRRRQPFPACRLSKIALFYRRRQRLPKATAFSAPCLASSTPAHEGPVQRAPPAQPFTSVALAHRERRQYGCVQVFQVFKKRAWHSAAGSAGRILDALTVCTLVSIGPGGQNQAKTWRRGKLRSWSPRNKLFSLEGAFWTGEISVHGRPKIGEDILAI
jgi:hypothetical protein